MDLMMRWLLRETCGCDVVIVLASASKQANILRERARAIWSHVEDSFFRQSIERLCKLVDVCLGIKCNLASQRALLWRELLMQAGCASAGFVSSCSFCGE